jgi:hypothetical protein
MIRKRVKIDTTDEKNLMIGIIISKRFCQTFLPMIHPQYLQSKHSKIIHRWVEEYYKEFEEPPGHSIQKVYEAEKEKLEEDEAEMVGEFLAGLSSYYEEMESFNEDYLEKRCLRYLKKQSIMDHKNKLMSLIDLGKVEEAETEIANFRKVSKATSEWVNPFEEQQIEQTLIRDEDYLFTIPGRLGQIIGPLKRTWLISLMGPMKRGKSWWLEEIKFAAMYNRLKVASISLEMEKDETSMRSYQRLTASTTETKNIFRFPIFDCLKNQMGSCEMSERLGSGTLINEEGSKREFSPDFQWTVCTYCLDHNLKYFVPEPWYEEKEVPTMSVHKVKKAAKAFATMYGKNLLRTISYPIKTANIGDIKRDLDLLEYTEDFIPDVILIDYMDILGSENPKLTGRDAINDTWMTAKSLAQQRGCLVATATQANRESLDKKYVKQKHTGEDIRKLAHVNLMAVLNQTGFEKRKNIMRIGVIASRAKYFDEQMTIKVLQQLDLGQPYLDAALDKVRGD